MCKIVSSLLHLSCKWAGLYFSCKWCWRPLTKLKAKQTQTTSPWIRINNTAHLNQFIDVVCEYMSKIIRIQIFELKTFSLHSESYREWNRALIHHMVIKAQLQRRAYPSEIIHSQKFEHERVNLVRDSSGHDLSLIVVERNLKH